MAAYIDHDPNIQERHITYALRYLAGRRNRPALTRKIAAAAAGVVLVIIAALFGYKAGLYPRDAEQRQEKDLFHNASVPQVRNFSIPAGDTEHEPSMPPRERHEETIRNMPGATVKYDTVNVRSAPTREAPRVALLYKGMHVGLYESASDSDGNVWYKIFESDKGSGWVSEEVLSIGQPSREGVR